MSDTRIYNVMGPNGTSTMVEACTPSQAVKHVTRDLYQVKAAKAMDVVEYIRRGGAVEAAEIKQSKARKKTDPTGQSTMLTDPATQSTEEGEGDE